MRMRAADQLSVLETTKQALPPPAISGHGDGANAIAPTGQRWCTVQEKELPHEWRQVPTALPPRSLLHDSTHEDAKRQLRNPEQRVPKPIDQHQPADCKPGRCRNHKLRPDRYLPRLPREPRHRNSSRLQPHRRRQYSTVRQPPRISRPVQPTPGLLRARRAQLRLEIVRTLVTESATA